MGEKYPRKTQEISNTGFASCPLCNKTVKIFSVILRNIGRGTVVDCTPCGLRMFSEEQNIEKVMDKWNTRFAPVTIVERKVPVIKDINKALEEVVDIICKKVAKMPFIDNTKVLVDLDLFEDFINVRKALRRNRLYKERKNEKPRAVSVSRNYESGNN